jgi:hypothetical protein
MPMTEPKPEPQIEAPAADAAPEKGAELTEKDLDQAAGGLWPYVLSGSSYNKTI